MPSNPLLSLSRPSNSSIIYITPFNAGAPHHSFFSLFLASFLPPVLSPSFFPPFRFYTSVVVLFLLHLTFSSSSPSSAFDPSSLLLAYLPFFTSIFSFPFNCSIFQGLLYHSLHPFFISFLPIVDVSNLFIMYLLFSSEVLCILFSYMLVTVFSLFFPSFFFLIHSFSFSVIFLSLFLIYNYSILNSNPFPCSSIP